jgi:uncharacterized membrane protein YdcZ (DUF606 family)
MIVHAAVDPEIFGRVIDPIISNIVNPLIGLIFAIAILVFVYGILEMIANAGDPGGREKGRWHIFGGLIGMFIMFSAWGIIYLISNTIKDI